MKEYKVNVTTNEYQWRESAGTHMTIKASSIRVAVNRALKNAENYHKQHKEPLTWVTAQCGLGRKI